MAYYNGRKILSVVETKYLAPQGTYEVSENGIYDIEAYKKVKVAVFPSGTITTYTDEDLIYRRNFDEDTLDYALINKVGGYSVVLNQLLKAINGTNTTKGVTFTTTAVDFSGSTSVVGTPSDSTADSYSGHNIRLTGGWVSDHKYLIAIRKSGTRADLVYVNDEGNRTLLNKAYASKIVTAGSSLNAEDLRVLCKYEENAVVNVTISVNIIDLTLMFGSGNEPTSTDDIRLNWVLTRYRPYNEGEVVSAKVTGISAYQSQQPVDELEIPAEVQALEGYGWGIGSVYNYIDFDRKVFVKNVARIDLGTLNFTMGAVDTTHPYGYFYASVGTRKNGRNVLARKFATSFTGGFAMDKVVHGHPSSTIIYIVDSSYASASDLRTAMSGVYLYYELATPIETDISEYIDNNLIRVSTPDEETYDWDMFFDNQYGMPSHNEITYQERE